jgi:hypothetical protein
MNWLRHCASWLRRVFRPDARVVVVPGAECAHDHDHEAVLRRLVLAVNDPQKFAEVLAQFADCCGCFSAVLVEAVYEMAGLVLDFDPDAGSPFPCACEHPVVPEAMSLRLALSFDSDDEEALRMALGQILECRACMLEVIMSLTKANVSILDSTKVSWRPMLERQLLAVLDDMA